MKSATKTSPAKAKSRASGRQQERDTKQDAVALLTADHRKVERLFKQYKTAKGKSEKVKLVGQICKELVVHTTLEEEIFYKACRARKVEYDDLDEAQVEHDGAKMLIRELMSQSPSDDYFDAKVTVLSEYIKHHVGEEEKPRSGIFAKAKAAGVDMAAVGARLAARKEDLMVEAERPDAEPPAPISFQFETSDGSRL